MVKHWARWSLLAIIITGLLVRLAFIPFNEYLSSGDAITYLKWAGYYSFYGVEPHIVTPLHNMGFVAFLSIFHTDAYNNDLIYLANTQRIATVLFSTATIPVIYYVAKRFFDTKYALIGAGLFAFDWRVIQNSTFGITEPLFLLLSFGGFALVFKGGRVWGFLAIILVGLSITVRIEGVLMLIVVVILYFHKYSISYKSTVHVILVLSIIIAPTLLIVDFNLHHDNPDGFLSKAEKEITTLEGYFTRADTLPRLANSLMYMGWATFPNYIFLLPLGIYWIVRSHNHWWFLGALVLLLSSGVFAYMDAFDTRYFFQSYVVLILISLCGVRYLDDKLYQRWKQVS